MLAAQTAPDQTAANPTGPRVIDRVLTGRAAWRAADVTPADWRVVLDDTAQAEILAVAETLRRQPVPMLALRPDDFALPACRAAMARASEMLRNGVRFALVERLPIDALSLDEAKAIYWLLSSLLARPVAQKLDGTMMYDVHDTGQKALPGSGVRPDKTNVDLQFHNDNAYNALMPEIVGLLCVRQAEAGGLSRVMSFATAHNALREAFPALLPRLYEPFWFDRQREHHAGEETTFAAPLFVNEAGELRARLALHQIRSGYVMRGGADDTTAAALDAVAAVFREPALQFSFTMQPGDMQFAANREIGHSRTEFVDHADPARKRLLIRLWLRDGGAPGYIG
jgi:hypothetical protein